jgi:putative FmdB family regulatory protein
MPIHDFECKKCGSVQEFYHSITDDSCPPCEKCGSETKRLISTSVSFKIKGGGTIRRDYKTRYGQKVKDSTPTPSESAMAKAKQQEAERVAQEKKAPGGSPYTLPEGY